MGRKLTASTYVGGEFFEAGSTPPKEVADQITNPKLWAPVEDDDTSSGGADTSGTAKKAAAPRKTASSPSK